MELESGEPRKRQMDTSNGEARRAVKATLARFDGWRLDLARFSAQADRGFGEQMRQAMLKRCSEIDAEVQETRTDLLINLADAPQRVAGHSRVVDVERALDNIDLDVAKLRRKLLGNSRSTAR